MALTILRREALRTEIEALVEVPLLAREEEERKTKLEVQVAGLALVLLAEVVLEPVSGLSL